jgi:hypothetical protein
VSSTPVGAEEPYYLYMTKDSVAGNPISMIYAEKPEQTQNFLFGMWANSYFFSPGTTIAYTYCMNEDLYMTLWEDRTVCTKIPVRYLDGITRSTVIEPVQQDTSAEPVVTGEPENDTSTDSEQPAETAGPLPETQPETTDPAKPEADPGNANDKYINLTMLTPRDGLPESVGRITGMRDPWNFSFVERTQRSDRVNKFQASVFSGKTGIALIAGGGVIIAAAAFVIFKKRSGKKAPAAPQKTKKAG